jgi:hypothetical protein
MPVTTVALAAALAVSTALHAVALVREALATLARDGTPWQRQWRAWWPAAEADPRYDDGMP